MYLPEGEQAMPLFCVSSTHSLTHIYLWHESGVALPGSTPVLWVNKTGVYKCTVRESEGSSALECCSREITVHGI